MSYRIQVNKKKYTIRIQKFPDILFIGVSVWRNGEWRCGTSVSPLTPINEIKQWAKKFIKENEGKYFTR